MLPYVWMPLNVQIPPICLDAPCMFAQPPYVWIPPYVWMAPSMFGYPLYVWTTPKSLDSPCMLGFPHIFGWSPVCLDAFSICLDACCTYTTQRKHALSDYGGVHMPPYIWMSNMFGCPLYAWIPHMFEAPTVCVWMFLILLINMLQGYFL